VAADVKVELKLTGLDGVIETLKSLPPEIVSKRGGPIKQALRKGAVVIAKQEKLLLLASLGTKDGSLDEVTHLLEKSIIVSRGKPPIGGNGERYLVRIKRQTYGERDEKGKLVKARRAGKKGNGKAVTTLQTAQLKEYGSSHQTAEPFIRPAFLSKAEKAIRTVETETIRAIERVSKKLLDQNKGK